MLRNLFDQIPELMLHHLCGPLMAVWFIGEQGMGAQTAYDFSNLYEFMAGASIAVRELSFVGPNGRHWNSVQHYWALLGGTDQPLPVRCMSPVLSEFSSGFPEAARKGHSSEIAVEAAEFQKRWYQFLRRDQGRRFAELIVVPGAIWWSWAAITVDGFKR